MRIARLAESLGESNRVVAKLAESFGERTLGQDITESLGDFRYGLGDFASLLVLRNFGFVLQGESDIVEPVKQRVVARRIDGNTVGSVMVSGCG